MIITDIDILHKKSKRIEKEELKDIIYLLEKELANTDGIGLSAIQINIPKQVFIVRYKDLKLNIWNPSNIKYKYEKINSIEGCLSFPNEIFKVERYRNITFTNGDGSFYSYWNNDAIVIQHELHHLFGVTIKDINIR